MRLEKAVLKKSYHVDIRQREWRTADLLIYVEKGNCKKVAETVLSKYGNLIASTSLRIGSPGINLMAKSFYRNSSDLHELVQSIKAISEVTAVEWDEVVKVLDADNVAMMDAVFGKVSS